MRRGALLWLGLAIAFSPVLINLVEGLRAEPADRYTLLVPLGLALYAMTSRRHATADAESGTRVGLGTALLAAGLFVELLGVASASWGIARLGLPIAALGISLRLGAPSFLVVLTVFGAIPLPSFVQHAASPEVETAIGGALAALFAGVGVAIESRGALLFSQDLRLEMLASDSGLITAAALFLGGWFTGLGPSLDLVRLLRRATLAAALVLAIHPALLVVAATLLVAGSPDAARTLLTHGASIAVAMWMLLAAFRPSGDHEAGPAATPETR